MSLGGYSKLRDFEVREIRKLYDAMSSALARGKEPNMTTREIGAIYSVTAKTIYRVGKRLAFWRVSDELDSEDEGRTPKQGRTRAAKLSKRYRDRKRALTGPPPPRKRRADGTFM